MSERRFWRRWWAELAAIVLLLVSWLVPVLAGMIWLWQHDWLLWWLVAAATASASAWGIMRLRHRPRPQQEAEGAASVTGPDPTWAPKEQAAWETVRQLSAEVGGDILEDRALMLTVAQETLEAVARHYHPERKEPALQFTLPELLLLVERLSARLRQLLLEHVPWAHRLKAGHLLRAWGYRPMVVTGLEHGRKAYTLFRIGRAINPLNALMAEIRDHLMDDLFQNVSDQVRRKVVRIWIEEVGRAGIELYSGRLRVDSMRLAEAAAGEGLEGTATVAPQPGALRVLIAGQTKAGKSTLVNRLLGELSAGVDVLPLTAGYEGYELSQEGMPPTWVIDSPGVENPDGVKEVVRRAFECDLIVWVVPAHRADRALDRQALDALRERFAADPQRKMPPLVVVASHIDRLTPAREWSPPYDVQTPSSLKERSVRGALEAIAADLSVPIDIIVPMRLDSTPPYNLELLWLRLASVIDDAQRARWVRILRTTIARGDGRRLWQQLASAGRMVGAFVKR